MHSLIVYADFNFLPAPQQVGVLDYDRVRGNGVYSFAFVQSWLKSIRRNYFGQRFVYGARASICPGRLGKHQGCNYTLTLDRTNWKFGEVNINVFDFLSCT